MALTAAEKQKAYRARRKVIRSAGGPWQPAVEDVVAEAILEARAGGGPMIGQLTQERFNEKMDALEAANPWPRRKVELLALVEDLYGSRASNTRWRLELRRALLG